MKPNDGDRQLLLQLVEAISPGAFLEVSSGQAAIDADDALIQQLTDNPSSSRKLRIWENQNCLVTTKRIARHERFVAAAEHSAKKGWPVYVRSTGGSTVVHRPGILNVSLAKVLPKTKVRPDDTYKELLEMLVEALKKLGVSAKTGFVENSYCDGRYNICVGDKKIAGTASRIVRRKGLAIYLCHASITVYGSVFHDVELVREFGSSFITDCEINPVQHVSLRNLRK